MSVLSATIIVVVSFLAIIATQKNSEAKHWKARYENAVLPLPPVRWENAGKGGAHDA